VRQRTRDIGVRMALGATRGDIVALVLRETSGMVGIGLAAGLTGALLAMRFFEIFMFGVHPIDPTVIAVSVAICRRLIGGEWVTGPTCCLARSTDRSSERVGFEFAIGLSVQLLA